MASNSNFRRVAMTIGAAIGVFAAGLVHAGPFSGQPVIVDQETPSTEGTETSEAAIVTTVSVESGSAVSAVSPAREYSVISGDYLSDIARRLLGDPARYQEIVRLNVDRYPSLAKNPNLILVGWQLRLPGIAGTSEPSSPLSSPSDSVAVSPSSTAGSVAQAPAPVSAPNTRTPSSGALPSSSAAAPAASAAPASNHATDGAPLIGPGQRVLHIGDSHTVGIYGSTIDAAMRETGAQIRTCGVAGSSPSWWYQGTVTKCGYYSRDEKGKVDSPADWRTPRATPSLPDMIREYKPTVLVVSLGANLFGASEATVKRETQRIIDTAKEAGCTLVWVGPPRAREDIKSIADQDRLCETIKATVGTQGTFVDSRPFTRYPSDGGDGLHYWGTEGSKTAKAWAGSVLDTIQTSGKK